MQTHRRHVLGAVNGNNFTRRRGGAGGAAGGDTDWAPALGASDLRSRIAVCGPNSLAARALNDDH